ncbi:unnamed protein product [Withania somnifera]
MLKTLDRYQKCSYGTLEVNRTNKDNEQSSYREYLKLKAKYESLQRYQRHLLGDELGPLTIDDLEHLEVQLDTSLKHIRSTRTQMMLDQLSEFQTKVKLWNETNKVLERKMEEIYAENNLQQPWGGGEQSLTYGQQQHAQSQGFFQPLECNSSLQIGYDPITTSRQITAVNNAQNVNGMVPGWML